MCTYLIVGSQDSLACIDISPQLKQSGLLNTSEYKFMYTGSSSQLVNLLKNSYTPVEPKVRDLIIMVIPLLQAEWDTVGYLLRFDTTTINNIKASNQNVPRKCCKELLIKWLETDHGSGTNNNTWLAFLNDIAADKNFTKATEDILEELVKKIIAQLDQLMTHAVFHVFVAKS